jgi:biotin carboxyl carrier protein
MKQYRVCVNNNVYDVQIVQFSEAYADVRVNGIPYQVALTELPAIVNGPGSTPAFQPMAAPMIAPTPVVAQPQPAPVPPAVVAKPSPVAPAPTPAPKPAATPAPANATEIKAPMPGVVLEVKVSEGQSVKAGDELISFEAMKMENSVQAPKSGTIKEIRVNNGQTIAAGQTLIILG